MRVFYSFVFELNIGLENVILVFRVFVGLRVNWRFFLVRMLVSGKLGEIKDWGLFVCLIYS